MFVDSHCHLDDKRFAVDLDAVLGRAAAAGVTRILTIGTGEGPPGIDCAVRVADRYPQVYASIGVHPHDAAKAAAGTLGGLRALASHPKVIAYGEIGLDYHYDFSPPQTQRALFIEQLGLANELQLPVIIHTREAWADTISILREHWRGAGIMHCFNGDAAQASKALDLGFHLSYGGIITFKNAAQVREAARITPDDRLLIETDAPYLAPAPHRGKRNEPAMMTLVVEELSRIRGTGVAAIGALTTANFERLCPRSVESSRRRL